MRLIWYRRIAAEERIIFCILDFVYGLLEVLLFDYQNAVQVKRAKRGV